VLIYDVDYRRVVAWDLSLASITPTLYRKDLTRPTWFTSHYRIINKGLEYLFGVYQFIRRFIGNEVIFIFIRVLLTSNDGYDYYVIRNYSV
jgi:hypothetical protein